MDVIEKFGNRVSSQALKEPDDGRLTRQAYLTEFYNRKKAR